MERKRTTYLSKPARSHGDPPATRARETLDTPAPSHRYTFVHIFKTALGRLRFIGWWEGVSFLVLLGIAMPLKYFAGEPAAVRVVGMAHGVLFVLYILAAVHAAIEYGWTWKRTALVMLASVLPAGPFIVDAKLLRQDEPKET